MNVHTLLTDATSGIGPAVDPETVRADLSRGRRALGRRRARRSGAVGLVAAAAVAGTYALGGTPHPNAPRASAPQLSAPQHSGTAPLAPGPVQLVDYTGAQLAGFSVDDVPAGWTLLHSDEFALTVGPADVPDADPESYEGKLTVLLMSKDAHQMPTGGVPVRVRGVPGVVMADGGGAPGSTNSHGIDPDELSLFFTDPASGQPVSVQVPAALHWSAQQAADFAAGVHVLPAAQRAGG